MENVIILSEFNNKGGFWHSSIIEKNLIDYFIPFMPMEKSHVKKCAKADLENKGHPVTDSILERVADELLYFPEDLKVFSRQVVRKFQAKLTM